MNRYEEQAEILAVMTAKIDRYGPVGGLKRFRGKAVRILVLLDDPTHPRTILDRRRGILDSRERSG